MDSVLEEKDAIRELMARYCFHFDNGEFEAWLQLFTPDGTFDLGSRGRFSGREALKGFLNGIPLTNGLPMIRHYVMNPIISVEGTYATAQSYVLVVHGGETLGLTLAGRYEDRLAKADGQWRFTVRKAHFDLMGRR